MGEGTETDAVDGEVLVISAVHSADECARAIGARLGCEVAVATTRREALVALASADFAVVVVEESLVEGDSAWADRVWELAGSAIPLQINFAISGCDRLTREIKAAFHRRARERAMARRLISAELEDELKTSVTGLLLESELILEEPSTPPLLRPKLQHMALLAKTLRERLRRSSFEADAEAIGEPSRQAAG